MGQLARQTTSLGNVPNVVRYALKSKEERQNAQSPLQMRVRWRDFEGYFNSLATQYEQVYEMLEEERVLSQEAKRG